MTLPSAHTAGCPRFFAFRVNLLKSTQRIIEFTSSSIIEYDLHGSVKEKIDYGQIVEVQPKKKDKKEFIIKTTSNTIVYLCYNREPVLSAYWEAKDIFSNYHGTSFDVSKISNLGEVKQSVLVVKNATLQRLNPTTGDTKFPKLITDIQQIYFHQDQEQVSIEFRHPTTHRYVMEDCSKFLTVLQSIASKNYDIQLPVIESPAPKFAVSDSNMTDDRECPRKYYFELKILKYGSSGTKERNLLLTSEFIYAQHPKTKMISSARRISTLTDLVLYNERGVVGLVYHGKYLHKLYVEPDMVDIFFANLMHLSRKNGNPFLEINFYEMSKGMRIEPFPRPPEFRHEEYFSVKRSYFIDQASAALVPNEQRAQLLRDLREFNSNLTLLPSDASQLTISATGPSVNAKKWIYWLIEWLNATALADDSAPNENSETNQHTNEQLLVMELIRFGQRFLGMATAMLTMVGGSVLDDTPEIKPVLITLLRSQHQYIAHAAAAFVKSIITQPKTKALTSFLNKSSIMDNNLVEEIFSVLGKNGKYHTNILAAHALIESLDICLVSQSQNTDPKLLLSMTTTLCRNVRTMYDLTQSPCLGISSYATVLLTFVFGHSKSNGTTRQLQEECLSRCVLIWLINQALSLPPTQHQEACAHLVGVIVGDNTDCWQLLDKVFPPTLLGKSALKKSSGELDWKEVFMTLRQDYLLPDLIWDSQTRYEICNYMVEQCNNFHSEVNKNPDHRYVWNFEEFRVNFSFLAREILAGKFYVRTILSMIPNCKVDEPDLLASSLLYKVLLSPTDPQVQVLCLKALTWCYSKYSSKIPWSSQQMEMVLSLLKSVDQSVVDHSLLLLQELFIVAGNIQEFVRLDGVSVITFHLTTIFGLSHKSSSLTVNARTEICLTLLQQCVTVVNHVVSRQYPPVIKFPMPVAKAQLSKYPDIFRIVQVLAYASVSDATGDSQQLLLSHTLTLIENILTFNDELVCEIYKTGIYYFLLSYGGNDVSSIESLCALIHRLHMTLKELNKPSPLRDLLPANFIDVVEKQGPMQLATIFRSSSYVAPNLVWNSYMRDYCRNLILKHIAPFLNLLYQGISATYQYSPMPPIEYSSFTASYLMCGGYYVDALLDVKNFPTFEIPNPYSLFVEACELLARVEQLNYKISTMKLILLLFNKYPQLAKQAIADVFSSFDKWIKEMSTLQVVGDEYELLISLMNEVTDLSLSSSPQNLQLFVERNGPAGVSLCLHFLLNIAKLPSSKSRMDTVFANVHTTLNILHRVVSAPLDTIKLDYITIRSILRCIDLSFPSSLCLLGMQIVEKLAAKPDLQQMLFKCGAHFYLLTLILQPVVTFTKASIHDPLASYAWTTLAHVSGALPKFPSLPNVSSTLSKILTPVIFEELPKVETSPEKNDFIAVLRKTHRTPTSLWTASTAKELQSFSLAWITEKAEDSFADNEIPVYSDHLSELQVGGVFVSILIVFPKWKLQNPLPFIIQVIASITYILNTQVLPALPPPQVPFQLHQPKNSKPLANVSVLVECVALVYANNLLTPKKEIDIEICNSAPLFLTVAEVSGENDGLRQASFNLLLAISSEQTFAEVASSSNMMRRLCLHVNSTYATVPLCVLKIVNNAIANSFSFARAVVESGMILLALQILLQPATVPETKRELAASILKKLASHHSYGSIVINVLSRILPPNLVKNFSIINEFLQFFDQTHESPELIWNTSMKQVALQQLRTLIDSYLPRLSGETSQWPLWDVEGFRVIYPDMKNEPQLAGVYVRLFNLSPKLPTNAINFLHELLVGISAILRKEAANIAGFSLDTLVEALYHLVTLQPAVLASATDEVPLRELLEKYISGAVMAPLGFTCTICKYYSVYCKLSPDVLFLLLKVLQSHFKESHMDCLDSLAIFIRQNQPFPEELHDLATNLIGCLITLLGSQPTETMKNRILDILNILMQSKRDLVIQNLLLRQDILSVLRKWDPKDAPPLPSAMPSHPSFLLTSSPFPIETPKSSNSNSNLPTSTTSSNNNSTDNLPPPPVTSPSRLRTMSVPPVFDLPPPPPPIDAVPDLPLSPPPPLTRSQSLPHLQEALIPPPPPPPLDSQTGHPVSNKRDDFLNSIHKGVQLKKSRPKSTMDLDPVKSAPQTAPHGNDLGDILANAMARRRQALDKKKPNALSDESEEDEEGWD